MEEDIGKVVQLFQTLMDESKKGDERKKTRKNGNRRMMKEEVT